MFIFPMAGMSKRFAAEGYLRPKYELPLHGHTVFYFALAGFRSYFDTEKFLFICRGGIGAENFITQEAKILGIRNFFIATLNHQTDGQAHTVMLGLATANVPDNEPITIFNIDSFRVAFKFPESIDLRSQSFVESFTGIGDSWSFIQANDDGSIINTVEKKRISADCSNGLYHFQSSASFRKAYESPTPPQSTAESREKYIAPMYRSLIADGAVVKIVRIDRSDIIFCGIPEEYIMLTKSPSLLGDLFF